MRLRSAEFHPSYASPSQRDTEEEGLRNLLGKGEFGTEIQGGDWACGFGYVSLAIFPSFLREFFEATDLSPSFISLFRSLYDIFTELFGFYAFSLL